MKTKISVGERIQCNDQHLKVSAHHIVTKEKNVHLELLQVLIVDNVFKINKLFWRLKNSKHNASSLILTLLAS